MGTNIRLVVRGFRKKPLAAALAIAILAIGIAATTAVFSVLNAIAFRDLPVRDPQALTDLSITFGSANAVGFSMPMVRELTRAQRTFSSVLGFADERANAEIGDELTQIDLLRVTGNFFPELGTTPARGRLIAPSDMNLASFSADPVAVLGYGFWQRRYGGDAGAIGQTIRLEGKPYTVVGVAPKGFSGFNRLTEPDVVTPIAADAPSAAEAPGLLWIHLAGRLTPGVSLDQARADLAPIWTATKASLVPANYAAPRRANFLALGLNVRSARRGLETDGRSRLTEPLWFVLALALVVMAVACLNVAGLMLARAAGQTRDIGIRMALGASRWAIRRRAVTEAFVLASMGSALGLLIATWAAPLLAKFMLLEWVQDASATIALQLTPDARTFGLVAAIIVATCVLFGTMPVWRLHHGNAADWFRGGSRVAARMGQLAPILVGAQVALALVASIDAGLLVRTLQHLTAAEPGFTRSNLTVADLMMKPGMPDMAASPATSAYTRQLVESIRAATGVRDLALAESTPLNGADWTRSIVAANTPGDPIDTAYVPVSPGFAQFLGLTLRDGRDFTWNDDTSRSRVAVVSESLARRLAPGRSALGAYINLGPTPAGQHIEVVGIVKDFAFYNVRNGNPFTLLVPLLQNPEEGEANVLLRGPVPGAALRQAVSGLGREYVVRTRSLDDIVNGSTRQEQFAAMMGSLFGGIAIGLAALGLYGLLAYIVSRRTREFAIRAALGARARAIVALVLKQGFWVAAAGTLVGGAVAFVNVRWLQSLLYGVTIRDALALGVVPIGLAVVSVVACAIPAARAAQVDPIILLRDE